MSNTHHHCGICLEDNQKQYLINLPGCSHQFHQDCISTWLLEHNTCPLCRKEQYEINKSKYSTFHTSFIFEKDESYSEYIPLSIDYINDLILSTKRGISPLTTWGVNGYGELYTIVNRKKHIIYIDCNVFCENDSKYRIYTRIHIIDKVAQRYHYYAIQNEIKRSFQHSYKPVSIYT